VELPRTLHGQLYLLAYDRNTRRFEYDFHGSWNIPWMLEYALRSAMLTDLYLTGYIEDQNGEAGRLKSHHDDPLMHAALNRAAGHGWSALIYRGGRTCKDVHDQLEGAGWIHGPPRRRLSLGRARVEIYDVDMVGALAGRVTQALHHILDDRPADPRSLAVGLIAVQAQMSVVSEFIDDIYQREQLRQMTLAAIEPILGLYNAIHRQIKEGGLGGGGGWGAGCGGGA
jgi:hypothetical protein